MPGPAGKWSADLNGPGKTTVDFSLSMKDGQHGLGLVVPQPGS